MPDAPVLIIVLLISFFTVIQSVFGIGLLVFGTPSFLLLGYPFVETLFYLLPSSLMVSGLQLKDGWNELDDFKGRFNVYCLPLVAFGVIAILYLEFDVDMKPLVGALLILAACTRLFSPLENWLRKFFTRFTDGYLMVMGLVHGFTNLGGSFITIYAGTTFERKEAVRAHIAYAYTFMVVVQLIVLCSLELPPIGLRNLALPVISGLIYLYVGQRLFLNTGSVFYHHLMTAFIAVFGVVLFF